MLRSSTLGALAAITLTASTLGILALSGPASASGNEIDSYSGTGYTGSLATTTPGDLDAYGCRDLSARPAQSAHNTIGDLATFYYWDVDNGWAVASQLGNGQSNSNFGVTATYVCVGSNAGPQPDGSGHGTH